MREHLFGKTLKELNDLSVKLGLPSFTGRQLAEWLYKKEVSSFEEMTNLSLKARALLKENYETGIMSPTDVQVSVDGTKKYLFPALEGKFIETAYIP
ncbi:MAG: 23S rRNA (adenine(2503)-C(2))-methyltransferase RlmN, partial [Bacteroidetes bacterium]